MMEPIERLFTFDGSEEGFEYVVLASKSSHDLWYLVDRTTDTWVYLEPRLSPYE